MVKQTRSSGKNKLSVTDIRILEGLALHGTRNRLRLAAKLGMPLGTLRHRIRNLHSRFSLHLQGNLYHTNIGLRKVLVFAESKPGYEELLYQCMKAHDYWLYVSQCIGVPKCLTIYGIPAGKEEEFEEFLGKLEELGVARDVDCFWTTCIHSVNVINTWFDNRSAQWVFPWDSWVREVQTTEGDLPYTLKESGGYEQMADWIDIMILKELEKNSAVRLKEIADLLNMSLQRVKYHFETHVIKMQMFEGPQIVAEHYSGLSPETYLFLFDFKNYDNFAKFAYSLTNKPFVRALGKAYGKNRLHVQIYLPRQQLRGFLDALSKLVRAGLLDTYEYVIQDLARTERDTIPYQLFKDENWQYDNKNYFEKLQSTLEKFTAAS